MGRILGKSTPTSTGGQMVREGSEDPEGGEGVDSVTFIRHLPIGPRVSEGQTKALLGGLLAPVIQAEMDTESRAAAFDVTPDDGVWCCHERLSLQQGWGHLQMAFQDVGV